MRLRASGAHLIVTIGRIKRLVDQRSRPLWLRLAMSLPLVVGVFAAGLPAARPG